MPTTLQTTRIYNNLGYWFLIFILLAFVGFYKTYFSVLLDPHPSVVHLHFACMALWMGMIIVQPLLIKYKKFSVHRTLGKLSYLVIPLVLITSAMMSKYSYFAYKARLEAKVADGMVTFTEAEILHLSAFEMGLPVFYILWLAIFFGLAIYHRKDRIPHSRYILAAALTFLGPTVDRIFIFWYDTFLLWETVPVEYFSYALINLTLILFLFLDKGNPKGQKALGISLSIYLIGQILYATVRETQFWEKMITILVNI
ncbi:hypothetical protein [Aquiflexum sp.]|uniref:hypothetical protein n=1 Tax=Aquiflexum sp. TaxID=1872584 RepID=UPI00359370E6